MSGKAKTDFSRMLWSAQAGKCFYCGCKLTRRPWCGTGRERDHVHSSVRPWNLDHLIPRTHGKGLNGNKVVTCVVCNTNKGNAWACLDDRKRARAMYLRLGVTALPEHFCEAA